MSLSRLIATIGDRTRQARLALGMTQAELAERVGWLQPNISAVEAGKRVISLAKLCELADALGVTVAHLVSDPTDR